MTKWEGYDKGGEDPLWFPETPFRLIPVDNGKEEIRMTTTIAGSEYIDVEITSDFGGDLAKVIDSVDGWQGLPDYSNNGGFGGTMESKVLRELDDNGQIVSVGVMFLPAQTGSNAESSVDDPPSDK